MGGEGACIVIYLIEYVVVLVLHDQNDQRDVREGKLENQNLLIFTSTSYFILTINILRSIMHAHTAERREKSKHAT